MGSLEVAQRYFDAWNRRDPAGVVELFTAGGTYADPAAGTLAGPAIAELCTRPRRRVSGPLL